MGVTPILISTPLGQKKPEGLAFVAGALILAVTKPMTAHTCETGLVHTTHPETSTRGQVSHCHVSPMRPGPHD